MIIEEFLLKNGWESLPDPYGREGGYSTMSQISAKWRKEGKETEIITGLNEVGFAPTLVYPIPKKVYEMWKVETAEYKDDQPPFITPFINRWLNESTDEEVVIFLDSLK